MSLLEALGIDHTVLYQLLIAIFTFVSVTLVVFKPFQNSLLIRLQNTEGSTDNVDSLIKKKDLIDMAYIEKTKELNQKIIGIFEEQIAIAKKSSEVSLKNTQKQIEAEQSKLAEKIQIAKNEFSQHKEAISKELAEQVKIKLLGKI